MGEGDLLCHRCGRTFVPGEGDWYVVRIEAFADPTPPRIDEAELAGRDLRAEMAALIEQLGEQSAQEMRDEVHRRMTLHLCQGCYRLWIERPVG